MYIITIDSDKYEDVSNALNSSKFVVEAKLEEINIIIGICDEETLEIIKNIPGVLGIEQEKIAYALD